MWKFLRNFDIFPYRPQIRVLKKEQFKSNEGAMITLLITALAIFLLAVFSSDMVESNNPEIIVHNKFYFSPPETYLDLTKFNVAIGMRNLETLSPTTASVREAVKNSSIYKEKIFDIEFKLIELLEDTFGNSVTRKTSIPAGPCNSSQFELLQDSNEFTNEMIEKRGLVCMVPENISLEGRYGSKRYAFLEISIRLCDPLEDEVCIANDEFRKTSKTFLSEVFLMDSLLDLSDHLEPVKRISKRIYTISSFNISKMTRIPMELGEVLTSDSWFSEKFNSDSVNYLHVNEPQESGFVDRTLGGLKKAGASINYEISLYDIKKIYERRYDKLYDILAKLGGLIKIFLILGKFFVSPFSKSRFHKSIAKAIGVVPDSIQCKISSRIQGSRVKRFFKRVETRIRCFFQRKSQYSKATELIKSKMDIIYLLKKIMELDHIKREYESQFLLNHPAYPAYPPKHQFFKNINSSKDLNSARHSFSLTGKVGEYLKAEGFDSAENFAIDVGEELKDVGRGDIRRLIIGNIKNDILESSDNNMPTQSENANAFYENAVLKTEEAYEGVRSRVPNSKPFALNNYSEQNLPFKGEGD